LNAFAASSEPSTMSGTHARQMRAFAMANIRRPRDQTFRKTDVVRALRAAQTAGVPNPRVEINRHGTISMPTDLKKYRGPARFKKTETTRVVRAALAAGLPVERVEVDPQTGRISVIVGKPGAAPADIDDLDAWLARREKDARPA
jgi:hypothetical protein